MLRDNSALKFSRNQHRSVNMLCNEVIRVFLQLHVLDPKVSIKITFTSREFDTSVDRNFEKKNVSNRNLVERLELIMPYSF